MNTDKLTVEGNKMIAEFMDVKPSKGIMGDTREWYKINLGYCEIISPQDDFMYHTSWDWLMPVVEKISEYKYPNYYTDEDHEKEMPYADCAYPRTFGMRDSDGQYMVRINANTLHKGKTLIEATWQAVIDFIQWYTLQLNNKNS